MKLYLLEIQKKIQKTDKSTKMSTNNKVSFHSRIQIVSGKRLCSDPNSDWTKTAMWKVDEAKMKPKSRILYLQKKHQWRGADEGQIH